MICGDLNTTQYNHWLKQYKKINMKCVFEICNKRYLRSFANAPIRLAHCFANKQLLEIMIIVAHCAQNYGKTVLM